MEAFGKTVVLLLLAAAGSASIGWTYAFLTERLAQRSQFLWRLVPIISISLPLFLHGAAWEATLGKFGWLQFSAVSSRRFLFAGLLASAWIHAITGAGWVALIVGAFLRRNRFTGEAAAVLEAGPLRAALWVTLPATKIVLALSVLWVTLIAATEISVVDLYGYRTLADEVYFKYALAPRPMPLLLASLFPLAVFFLLGAWLILPVAKQLRPMAAPIQDSDPGGTVVSPVGRAITQLTLTLLAILMVVLPLASLVIKAGWVVDRAGSELAATWSLAKAIDTVTSATTTFAAEFYWTILLIAVVVALTLPCSVLLSLVARCLQKLTLAACIIAALVPGPVINVLMILFFSGQSGVLHDLYARTLIPTALCVMHLTVPASVFIFVAARQLSGLRSDEAATLEGAPYWIRFRYLELPGLMRPAIYSGFVTAAIALADISATGLMLPPGVYTVARRVFGLLHSGVRYQESGLCLITASAIIATILLARLVLFIVNRRSASFADRD